MNKYVLLTTALLTLASAAQAQTPAPPQTPAPAPAQNATLTDVPQGHWAQAAVNLLIQKGVLLGYPDGTFRGGQPVTRYELAVMLSRVLSQNLLQTPSAQQALTPADLEVIVRGIKEVGDQIVTIDTRLRDAVRDIDNLKERLGAAEQALTQVIKVAVTRSELEAATGKVTTDTQAALAGKADTSTVTTLQAQVDALTKTVTDLQTQIDAQNAKAAGATEQAALQSAAAINGQVFTDPSRIPNAQFTPDKYTQNPLYVGGGVSFGLGGSRGYGVVVGSDRATSRLGGLGVRASGAYLPAARAYSLQANATKSFGDASDGSNRFSPYLGLGGGVLVSPQRADDTRAANDLFLSALAGVNYNFTDTLRLYGEVDGRYYLNSKGLATGFGEDRSGVGLHLSAGVKVYF